MSGGEFTGLLHITVERKPFAGILLQIRDAIDFDIAVTIIGKVRNNGLYGSIRNVDIF